MLSFFTTSCIPPLPLSMPRGAAKAFNYLAKELSSPSRNESPPKGKGQRRNSGSGWSSGGEDDPRGPRIFPHHVKEQCWKKAEQVPGRDPTRWRRDAVGNIVFKKLNSCEGCLCHDYDHKVPYSKGGLSNVDNCQILQTKANRAKSSRENVSRTELQQRSVVCVLSRRDMDAVELAAYGNVDRTRKNDGGCKLQ